MSATTSDDRTFESSRPEPLTEEQILAWADAYRAVTGRWPTQHAAPLSIPCGPTARWAALDLALRRGYRGLHGGFGDCSGVGTGRLPSCAK